MRSTCFSCLSVLMVTLAIISPANAADSSAETEPPNPLTDPANPLTDVDPFAGEFEGDELIVIVKISGDGYVGEIRRAGRSFPMKAAREGNTMVGAFTFEKASFKFTARFQGQQLSLNTNNKDFTLSRRDATGATPTPAPPKPTVPAPNPAPDAVGPVKPKPTATEPIDYSVLSSPRLRDLPWARFPAGSFAVFEDFTSSPKILDVTLRTKLVYGGISDDNLVIHSHAWEDGAWGKVGHSIAPQTGNSFRINEMGYTLGETRTEEFILDNRKLSCECTRYTTETKTDGATMKLEVDVWRSREVDHPPVIFALPGNRLLVEPDMVRVTATSEFKGATAVQELKLEALRKETTIGKSRAYCDVMKGVSKVDRGNDGAELHLEYWLSHQVPGGVVKRVEDHVVGTRINRRSSTVVEFGVAK